MVARRDLLLNFIDMGIFDFFKKGKEEPAKRPESKPPQTNQPRSTPGATAPSSSSPSGTSVREYTIQPGDSLSKIAKKHYGNAADWQKIHLANKDKIKDPNMIFPGQKIIIP